MNASGSKILVADDRIVVVKLTRLGYEATGAQDGHEAPRPLEGGTSPT